MVAPRLRLWALALCAAILTSPAFAASVKFTALLDGAQAGSTSAATGTAELFLSDAQDSLAFTLSVTGLGLEAMTGGHIHLGAPGTNGPIVFGFDGPVGPNNDLDGDTVFAGNGDGFFLTSVWDGLEGNNTTLAAQLDNLFAGNLYFNLHSAAFPTGEIRGQIVPVAPVPLPAGGLLLVSGLGALALRAKRRRASYGGRMA